MGPLAHLPFADSASDTLLRTVASRWADAGDRAAAARAALPSGDLQALVDREVAATGRRLAALGAAQGAVAATPGFGTIASTGLMAANAVPETVVLADLIMVIGRLHGLVDDDLPAAQEAVTKVLWGDEGDRRPLFREGLAMTGKAIRRLPGSAGSALVRVAVSRAGRLAPFGLGAALGARGGWVLARRVGEAAHQHFGRTARERPEAAEREPSAPDA